MVAGNEGSVDMARLHIGLKIKLCRIMLLVFISHLMTLIEPKTEKACYWTKSGFPQGQLSHLVVVLCMRED